ncbi:MAG: tRNA glutamyl-Q(34) synthetase GluQRS [Verrucomicrobiota bacterium]
MDSPTHVPSQKYRGRLAPSPTGLLHVGHAKTFWTAQERVRRDGGELILRNEDLDQVRCRKEFVSAMVEDLRWFGFNWSEGPDVGGRFAPYSQSERMPFYCEALEKLQADGYLYPCTCSRRDVQSAVTAPHVGDEEPIYPGRCRGKRLSEIAGKIFSWRFRVPEGEAISFTDENVGEQRFVAGRDFGDFVVWRPDGVPAYQLACVVDDVAMQITEVVRGADLLVSTARQILIYRALGRMPPLFFHCELVKDQRGRRLAKRHDSLSLRKLRAHGMTPDTLRKNW